MTITLGENGSANQLRSDLASTASAALGDALVGFKQSNSSGVLTGASATTVHKKLQEIVSVKDFGAVGDGSTDDTDAIQAAFDYLHSYQNTLSQFTNFQFLKGCIYFPEGNYKITSSIKVRAYVAIKGVGTGYLAGSVLHQMTANTHIFEFYEANTGGTALGTEVDGLCFEFDRSLLTTNTGFALYYPKASDNSPYLTLSSNSHYIKNNHCGGWHDRGGFLKILNSNDVELTGNIVDVCSTPIAIQIGDQTNTSQCSDVRITQNNFYGCYKSICIYGMITGTIHGNNFSNSYLDYNSRAISLVSNGTITAGYNNSITITGNTFFRQNICLAQDGSARNVVFTGNSAYECNNAPILFTGTTDIYRTTITGNTFHLSNVSDPTAFQQVYSNTVAPLYFDSTATLYDSVIADNTVDANTIATVVGITNDQTTSSFLNTGNTLRNNIITNNSGVEGANKTYLPCKSWGLTVDNVKAVTQLLPVTALPIFSLTTIAVGDSVCFDLDYEIKCDDAGLNVAGAIGRVRISVMRWASAGTLKSSVTVLNSTADDYNGGGGANLPTVTWAVTTASPAVITCTVSDAGLTTSTITTITARASSFLSGGVVGIKAV